MSAQEPGDALAAGLRRLAEEGGRLLGDLARSWPAAPAQAPAQAPGPAEAPAPGEQAAPGRHAGPGCTSCPVCQGVALVRELRPEAVHRVVAAAADLAAAVGELLAPAAGHPHVPAAHDGHQRPRAPRVPVQHIDITD